MPLAGEKKIKLYLISVSTDVRIFQWIAEVSYTAAVLHRTDTSVSKRVKNNVPLTSDCTRVQPRLNKTNQRPAPSSRLELFRHVHLKIYFLSFPRGVHLLSEGPPVPHVRQCCERAVQ